MSEPSSENKASKFWTPREIDDPDRSWYQVQDRRLDKLRAETAEVLRLHRNPADPAHKLAVKRLAALDEVRDELGKSKREKTHYRVPDFPPILDALEPLMAGSTRQPTLPSHDGRAAAAGTDRDPDEGFGTIDFDDLRDHEVSE